jgi:single-strand DNA-binding protein
MASNLAFGKLTNNCERLLSKGRQVYLEGPLRPCQFEAKDGSGTRYRTEIVAHQMPLSGNRAERPCRARPGNV